MVMSVSFSSSAARFTNLMLLFPNAKVLSIARDRKNGIEGTVAKGLEIRRSFNFRSDQPVQLFLGRP